MPEPSAARSGGPAMAADAFASHLDGLAFEHRRLEGLVAQLSAENERLREELMNICTSAISGMDSSSLGRCSDPSSRRLEVHAGDTPVNDDNSPRRAAGLCRGASDNEGGRLLDSFRGGTIDFEGRAAPPALGKHPASEGTALPRMQRHQGSARTLGSSGSNCLRNCTMATDGSSGLPPRWSEWSDAAVNEEEETDPTFVSTVETRVPRSVLASKKAKSGGRLVDDKSCCRHIAMHPGGARRTVWDTLSLIIVCYDLVYVPFEMGGFEVPEATRFLSISDKCIACFWLLDIFMSFSTGYHTGGLVEMRLHKIGRKYARSWLALDVSLVITDWVFIFLGGFTFLRIGKSRRLLRILRAVRIVRSVKMSVKMVNVLDGLRSEALRILLNIAGLALLVLALNHYFACGWYYIGRHSDADDNWIVNHVAHENTAMRYATALHWSFTQFTPAGMEIHPSNFSERVYTVVTDIFAMITFSSFLGSIAANMTALRRLSSEPAAQQKVLQEYFTEQGISAELGMRIWGYLQKNHFAHKKKAERKDIGVLEFLPPSITSDLNKELYDPVLKLNPFFFHFSMLHAQCIREICDNAVSENTLTLGEKLFRAGSIAESMYIVTQGRMYYAHRSPLLTTVLRKCQWVSEPCLWMRWYYCGTLEAETSCQVLGISSRSLRELVSQQAKPRSYVRAYINGFRSWMTEEDANEAGQWKTDVWLQVVQLKRIVFEAMPEAEMGGASSFVSHRWRRPAHAEA